MAPCKRGTVILSLKRMDRIIEINEDLCYALVEPEVTHKQLYDHIRENRYKLWLNIPTGVKRLQAHGLPFFHRIRVGKS